MPGVFITLEGPEGAGKTLQAERLAEALSGRGERVRLTREPGGTRLGDQIRSIVLARAMGGDGATEADSGAGDIDTEASADIDARADALLFNAARAQLVAEVIAPALAADETVICARFADSTLAYQGYGAGVPLEVLREIAMVATAGLTPDRTILLDIAPEVGLARKPDESRNRFEAAFDLEFHRRVRDGFLELARQDPERWRVVDASRDADRVFADVLAATESIL